MLKNQNGQVVGKATFSTWVTQTKAEFRESELFLLPQVYWMTTVPKQRASDGNAQTGNGCKDPALRKCLDVYPEPTSHKEKTNLSEGSLAVTQQEFVVPQSQLEWSGSQWQSCPDNLLLCMLTRTAPCRPPRHSWGRAPQECCSMWHSPTHCSEPSSPQQVPHITVHRSPFFPSQAQSKITFFLYTPMFLPSPFYLFFFKFVFMKTALSFSEDNTNSLSFLLCLLSMASKGNPMGTMVTSHPIRQFCPA